MRFFWIQSSKNKTTHTWGFAWPIQTSAMLNDEKSSHFTEPVRTSQFVWLHRIKARGLFFLPPKRSFGAPPKRTPVLFAFSGTPSLHTFWCSVGLLVLTFLVNYFGYFAAKKTVFEFLLTLNLPLWGTEAVIGWTQLGDDLHLDLRQDVVCRRRRGDF